MNKVRWLARVWPVLFLLGVGTIPVATGLAILKHHLYDIDLVINQTFVYGSPAVMLVSGYAGRERKMIDLKSFG